MAKYEKGRIVKGIVTGIETYGVFVSFDEYYSGLIHISEISHGFVSDIHDYVKIGDIIYVEILDVDEATFHLKLSIKNISYRRKYQTRYKKIQETPHGFETLEKMLPYWIAQSVKNETKVVNSIDKI